ncbi:MAG TPA: NAD(P)-binding domain-containing protein [Candidatus Solibacter sp.]|nr:NAD(P)-binding domain-containing protein [Candidatus Solibacter sp.]
MDSKVIIIGAGPYGLSTAAYLRRAGIVADVFGDPMSFWRNHMPAGMFLRSNWKASHIASPGHELSLDRYQSGRGKAISTPIPLGDFVDYGLWYQQQVVPQIDRRQVASVEKNGSGFGITLNDGQKLKSNRVVVATGIAPFPYRPEALENLPESHVTHSSDHKDLSRFRGKRLLIVGGGQSGLDAARILQDHEASAEVLSKARELYWVGGHAWLHHLGLISKCLYSGHDVGPAGISRLVGWPHLFRKLPRSWQDRISYRAIRPAGTAWMIPYLKNVLITLNVQVTSAQIMGDRVCLKLSDGTERMADHVIVATGYRVDAKRFQFLSPELHKALKVVRGYPVLDRGMESSVPGLHFVGKPAAWSFGPLLNFISGTEFASTEFMRNFR